MTSFTKLNYTTENNSTVIACRRCAQPLLYPVLCTRCEYYTCKSCLIDKSCCSGVITMSDVAINGQGQLSQALSELQVYCPVNGENGCDWTGPRSILIDHCESCQLRKKCIFGCNILVMPDDIDHLDSCKKFLTDDTDEKGLLVRKYFTKKISEISAQTNKPDIEFINMSTNQIIVNAPLYMSFLDYYQANSVYVQKSLKRCPPLSEHQQFYTNIDLTIMTLTLPDFTADWSISLKLNTTRKYSNYSIHNFQIGSSVSYVSNAIDNGEFKFNHHVDAGDTEYGRTINLRLRYLLIDDESLSKLKSGIMSAEYQLDIGTTHIIATRV